LNTSVLKSASSVPSKGATVEAPRTKECVRARFLESLDALPDACLTFAEILVEALELHTKKSRDYGSGEDPYANVRASEEFGVAAWKGGLLRANDKVTRLKQFSQKGELANESAEDSLIDLCVYFPIILMLYRQASQQVRIN
jgi:hypothetical protein